MNRLFAALVVLWLPLHFTAQVTPPILALSRKTGSSRDLASDSQRESSTDHAPGLSTYLDLFGVVRAYGFFADTRHQSFRFRIHEPDDGPGAYAFPPDSWSAFEYDFFQMRLFEALAFHDDRARTYLGRRACENWPAASTILIEKSVATRNSGDAESTSLEYAPIKVLHYSRPR